MFLLRQGFSHAVSVTSLGVLSSSISVHSKIRASYEADVVCAMGLSKELNFKCNFLKTGFATESHFAGWHRSCWSSVPNHYLCRFEHHRFYDTFRLRILKTKLPLEVPRRLIHSWSNLIDGRLPLELLARLIVANSMLGRADNDRVPSPFGYAEQGGHLAHLGTPTNQGIWGPPRTRSHLIQLNAVGFRAFSA